MLVSQLTYILEATTHAMCSLFTENSLYTVAWEVASSTSLEGELKEVLRVSASNKALCKMYVPVC